jgi:transposase
MSEIDYDSTPDHGTGSPTSLQPGYSSPDDDHQTSSDDTDQEASETDGVYTSDNPEDSGSDDERFSSSADSDSDSSGHQDVLLNLSPKDKRMKNLVASLIKTGHHGPAIIRILALKHGIKISTRTLTRKRNEWGLRRCDLSPAPIPAPLSPEVRASILSSQSKGMNLQEMQVCLYKETGVEVSGRTVQRYMKKLGIKLLPNDLLDGKVTMDQVFEAINHARDNLLQNNAGYRRMRMILMRQYNIRIPRSVNLFSNPPVIIIPFL